MIKPFLCLQFLFFSLILYAQILEPEQWELPDQQVSEYSLELKVRSDFSEDQEISIITSDARLSVGTVGTEDLLLPAGDVIFLPLSLNVSEYTGTMEFTVILSFSPSGKTVFFPVGKNIVTDESLSKPITENSLEYFFSPNCRSCLDFLEKELPLLEKKLGMELDILQRNIMTPGGMERLEEVSRGHIPKEVPILAYRGTLLAGEDNIYEHLEALLSGELDHIPEAERMERGIRLLPVLAAGLLDGVNPCAFSTLIFLLSFLTLRKGSKKTLLITGLSFTAAVGFTYFLVGLGLFHGLRSARNFQSVSLFIDGLFIFILLILAVFSFRDFILARKNRISEISLQLPAKIKDKIKGLIKRENRKDFGLLSGFILGGLISLYELGCTGQVYLPTLAYMVETGESGIFLLVIYNLAFILPLLAVFLLAYKGVSSTRFIGWFQKNLAMTKLLMALFFAVMAFLLLIRYF